MDDEAYRQYAAESTTWLHRGRTALVGRLLERATAGRRVGRLLEVGAGVGQNLDVLARFGPVDAGEISPVGQERIRAAGIAQRLYTDDIPFEVEGRYGVWCALDVIEHLDDDRQALRWARDVLTEHGVIVVTVPAYQWLYGDHDRALGHFRRYSRRSLRAALPEGLEVLYLGYFNSVLFPLVAASRLFGALRNVLRGPSGPPSKQTVAMPRPVDRLLGRLLAAEAAVFASRPIAPFGLSVVLVARVRRT